MIKVHKRLIGPELCPKLLPGHHFPRGFKQHAKYLKGLLPHFHFCPELPQLPGAQVERGGTEQSGSWGGHLHIRESVGRGFYPGIRPDDCEAGSSSSQEPS